MATLLERVKGIFGVKSVDAYTTDKVTLSNMPLPKVKGNSTPTPVFAKAVHAGMVYNPSLSSKNGEELYTPPEYNLSTVANCLDTDSYFRRAVEKYVELMWKNSYTFYGKNPNAVTYVRKRFEQIGMVTGYPTDLLYRDISYQLIQYGNAYISKVRDEKASGGKRRKTFTGQELAPVAGYFIEDSVSMQLAVKENGDPIGYKQLIPGKSMYKIWRPWNIIHMHHSRKPGLRVGTPMVWPVLDDIRALRRIEQNVELLVFQHTVPLFQYVVGTDARPAQPDEIIAVKATVERMPPNGCVVTPERHEVKAIGVEGTTIDAAVYLEYYKNRVLSGLGMSGVGMGEGGTSNKGTAVVLDKHLVNTTAMFQQIFKTFVDEFMIKEILAEGGFETSWEDEDNKVGIMFPPIDTEEQRAKENHYAQLYTQHAVNEDEMRKEFGREPVVEEQRAHDYFELILKPLEMIKAKLAQETAVVAGQAKPVVTKTASGASKIDRPKNVGANREQPTNQHGTLSAKPKFPKNDEVEQLLGIIRDTKNDLIDSCIDALKEDLTVFDKLVGIKRYNIDNSKAIIEEKRKNSTLIETDIYDIAIKILDEGYDKFTTMQETKRITDITFKVGAVFDTLSQRLEALIVNNDEVDISDLNSDS